MRRYSVIVILHILGILLSGGLLSILLQYQLWFSAILVIMFVIAISIHLYKMQMTQIRMMRHLAESLRYDDWMLNFQLPYQNHSMEDLVEMLSDAMQTYRMHALERNEMESWQKLIRVLTHEIMNSLSPIISLSATLSERKIDEKNYRLMQQGMQTIHRRSKGLLDFVENYRKLTRLPAPQLRTVSLCELLKDLQNLFTESFISIQLPQKDYQLQIDRSQIEQVFINLIKNAIEACKEQPHPCIRVELLPASAWRCLVQVSDNGSGMLPEIQDKVFIPFFTTKAGGQGIGLSLCKQIMNRHGGNITLESEVDKGTRFILQFK